ncbi:hypothetical protein F444_20590 [Phytophthora nicotianae P1976]|uniref:Uncharacterized protein n=1 Tax=Phytophthora nicotianae P1976 TaxID=1317066 RepID=A0A080Z437_PHYNI|nr:hypothetical protein F444_20590 [Phytophthora nicotianae P1976]
MEGDGGSWSASFQQAYSGHDVDTDGRTDGENASDAGVLSTLKPADAIGMAKFMEEMEMANVESVSETRSDSDVPQTQPAAVAVVSTPVAGTKSEADESLQQERVLPISLEATTTIPTSRDREGRNNEAASADEIDTRTFGLAQVFKLSVTLDELVAWARNTPNMKFMLEIMNKYPVLLEDAYLRTRTIVCVWEANSRVQAQLRYSDGSHTLDAGCNYYSKT